MFRAPASRRLLVAAGGVVAAAGIGFGAYTFGSASDATTPQTPRIALEATATPQAADAKDAPTGSATSTPPAALSLEQAKAVAARVAPGRVIEWDEDREPTGLRYDVTLLHADGTTTDVEVDTVSGQVTSIDHDDDRD